MSDYKGYSPSRGCWTGNFPTGHFSLGALNVSVTLGGSVGQGGRNKAEDVICVQRLLNNLPLVQGPPQPPLKVDGLVGRLTIGAILRFQQRNLGRSDGLIDPRGPTIAKLEAFNEEPSIWLVARMMKALNAFTDAEKAIYKTLLELDKVSFELLKNSVKLHDLFPGRTSWKILDRHFEMGGLSADAKRSSLQFIRQTYANMRAILTRPPLSTGNPWGANIIAVDPRRVPERELYDAWAYTTSFHGNQERLTELGLCPGHIYFTSRMDNQPPDFFLMALLHELAHFVNDQIVDQAYAGFEVYKYQHLPHQLRLLNADCYALLAFQYFAGQDRMGQVLPRFPLEFYPVD